MRNTLVLVAISTLASPTFAGPMYKCVEPNGEVVYQDRACSGMADNQSDRVHINPPPKTKDRMRAQRRLQQLRINEELDRMQAQQDDRKQTKKAAPSERQACFKAIESDYQQHQYALKDYASRLCAANLSTSEMRSCMDEFDITTIGKALTKRGAELHIRTCIRMHSGSP